MPKVYTKDQTWHRGW